ncbi:MAG: transglutaminase domain-containing protein [Firmicutes bacterium]|nr:transglutaminase domain-containing protein [Bacillota bacterium]
MREFVDKYLPRWLLLVLITSAAVIAFPARTYITVATGTVIGFLLLWITLLLLTDRLAKIIGPILLFVLTFLLVTRLFSGTEWIGDTLRFWKDTPYEDYAGTNALVLLGGAAVALVLLYPVQFFWSRLALACAWVIVWLLAAIFGERLPKTSIVLMMPLVLFTLTEVLRRRRLPKTKRPAIVLLICCLISSLLFLLPTDAQPYPYKLLHAAWDEVQKVWEKIDTQLHYRTVGDSEFSIDSITESGNLVGTDEDKDYAHLVKVWLDFGGSSVVYLPGTTWNYFDGTRWKNTAQPEDPALLEWNLDTAEHVYALWRTTRGDPSVVGGEYLRKRALYIDYYQMNTRTLFTTPNLLSIRADESRYPFQTYPGKVLFNYMQEEDTSYRLYFLETNARMTNVIRDAEGYSYDAGKVQSWGQIAGTYEAEFLLDMEWNVQIEELLYRRQEEIYHDYLALPENLSTEIQKLADEIVRGKSTDYEKIVAIEHYLKTNYGYNLHPTFPDENTPVLDHLLFETKEGYCTWFATAASVLCRVCGIPTRYVEGYRTELEQQNALWLDDDSRHAWCEAYLPGYGWIVLEATPGFIGSQATWDAEGVLDVKMQERRDAEKKKAEENKEPVVEKKPVPVGKIVLIVLAMLILGGAATFFILWDRKKKAYAAMSYSEKIRADLPVLLAALSRRGYDRKKTETLRHLFRIIHWPSYGLENDEPDRLLKIYHDVIFGEKELGEEEWQFQHEIVRKLSSRRKVLRMLNK